MRTALWIGWAAIVIATAGCSSSEPPQGYAWKRESLDAETDFYTLVPEAEARAAPPKSGVTYEYRSAPAAAPCPAPAPAPTWAATPAPPAYAAPSPFAAPVPYTAPAGTPYAAPAPRYAAAPPPPPPAGTWSRPVPSRAAAPAASTSAEAQLRARLESLERLRGQGVLTEDEYRTKRQQVIDAYNP